MYSSLKDMDHKYTKCTNIKIKHIPFHNFLSSHNYGWARAYPTLSGWKSTACIGCQSVKGQHMQTNNHSHSTTKSLLLWRDSAATCTTVLVLLYLSPKVGWRASSEDHERLH